MRNTRVSPAYAENGPGIVNRSIPTTRNPREASCQLAMLPTEPTPTTATSVSTTVTAVHRSFQREPDALGEQDWSPGNYPHPDRPQPAAPRRSAQERD